MKGTSKLILGTVQFGLAYGINNLKGKPDKETVFEILSYAYQNGIRYLDTAELYGDAHDLIGEFHKTNPSKKFQIITKFPHDFEESLDHKISTYLSQLNVERLNAILFHSFDSYLNHREQIGDMVKFKSKKFKYLGVSVYTNEEMNEVIEDINIDIIQTPFNLFDNLNLKGKLLQKAKAKNKIILTRSAFLQGLFFMKKDNPNAVRIKLEKEWNAINAIAQKSLISIGSIALNYCLVQPNIDGVLIGVDSLDQLKENISFSKQKIPLQYFDQINSIIIDNVELLNPTRWT
jgi:aryl-alcohol dehydrogenase-like predicted oxidoreductase